jgi:hypothetical protein
MRGVMTNTIDRDQWLNVTSESRDRTRDPRVPEPKRTPLGYILYRVSTTKPGHRHITHTRIIYELL